MMVGCGISSSALDLCDLVPYDEKKGYADVNIKNLVIFATLG
jgi:hypothetical protein